MSGQRSIPKSKVARAASLAATGAKIGVNYLKYKGRSGMGDPNARASFHDETAIDTYKAFSKLKGGPLKVAQMLSLDQNLMPDQYIREFSKAQYTAPPLSYPLVVRSFQREFGKKPTEIFDEFSTEAVAGASIGQVHKARKNGKDYAVKVQYPGVADSLDSDLRIVRPLAMALFKLDAETIDPYLGEVKKRLLEETDYAHELRRSVELSKATAEIENVRFPTYYPELSRDKILTMDWIDGLHVDQFAKTDASQEERNQIGQSLWDFYHHQIHELRIFHADPHAGNFIVKDGQLWVLDFGCVKALEPDFYQDYFALMACYQHARESQLDELLERLTLFKVGESVEERNFLRPWIRESIELLGRPFWQEEFDFSDATYLREIFEFGERAKVDPQLQRAQRGRGNPEALYLNRAYFGLYNLEGMLRAKIRISMPGFLKDVA
ncbi:AarF/ABC1/UbiB kinase family protein [Luteolibacter pohnpeiensis]|uniref:AarF/ABC1/UbiB kinase family protein n=1 Tax=Luteolibacter pohnpeiensis TaxID=454153 RepID=A0A934S473_9BACT|nr:AarF/ABC1/UbiB kinase family protein [Luteolibacter pohnpeiensis]MBK1882176.1 AarF/ABC1/UbiB kinase family protein [Luteolibacter pohnpeiensis]